MVKQLRKNVFIHRTFQTWFLRYTIGIVLVLSGVYYAAIALFFYMLRARSEDMGLPPASVFMTFLNQQEKQMDFLFLLTLLLALSFTLVYGLLQSNKIAGPLVRMKNYLDAWRPPASAKQSTDLVFRKGDFFKDLADSINRCLNRSVNRSEK